MSKPDPATASPPVSEILIAFGVGLLIVGLVLAAPLYLVSKGY